MEFRAFQNPNSTSNKGFDLIQCQREARAITSPMKLFLLWEDVCRKYDHGLIGRYEWEEMKDTIWPSLESLSKLQHSIDEPFIPHQSAA